MDKVILMFFLIVTFSSCGGTIGSIEKYQFKTININTLKSAIDSAYKTYPNLSKQDTSLYGTNNGQDYFFVLNHDNKKYVFLCNIIGPTTTDSVVELSLTTATVWGNVMRLAPKMSLREKRKYENLFEKNILPKIKEFAEAED